MSRIAIVIVGLLWPLAAQAQTVEYYHLDALGSVRAITNQAGAVIERHDYLPFGDEVDSVGTANTRKFTGKERDVETGYYGAKTARFTTVDPVYTWRDNLVDPQRWNRYAYVRNNPLRFTDPDGRDFGQLNWLECRMLRAPQAQSFRLQMAVWMSQDCSRRISSTMKVQACCGR